MSNLDWMDVFNLYPHTGYGQINLDWILSMLPRDVTRTLVVPDNIRPIQLWAIKTGNAVHIHALLWAETEIPSGTVVLQLPAELESPNYHILGYRYAMGTDMGGIDVVGSAAENRIATPHILLESQAIGFDVDLLFKEE